MELIGLWFKLKVARVTENELPMMQTHPERIESDLTVNDTSKAWDL